MKTQLYKNYYLDIIPLNYVLLEKKINNKEDSKNYGEEYYDNLGYFPTLGYLITFLKEHAIREAKKSLEWEDMIGLLERINIEIQKNIEGEQ